MKALTIPVSLGEAADKVTILEIKRARIADPGKLANIEGELAAVGEALFPRVRGEPGFNALFEKLKAINERLWDIEEDIRHHEARGDFGPTFIQLARAVYCLNDERAKVKRQLNLLFGSPIVEEKSYIEQEAHV